MNASGVSKLSEVWAPVLALASGNKISLDDIVEVVAENRGAPESWPWVGIFALKDGRSAVVYAEESRDGWKSDKAHAAVYVENDIYEAVKQHVHGDSFISLSGQFSAWHTRRCAEATVRFLNGDTTGWKQYILQSPGCSPSVVRAFADAVAHARNCDDGDRHVQVMAGFQMIVRVRYLVEMPFGHNRKPSSKPRSSVATSMKRCDSCKEDFELSSIDKKDHSDAFWRCEGCSNKLFSMLSALTNTMRPRLLTRRQKLIEHVKELEAILLKTGPMVADKRSVRRRAELEDKVGKLHALDLQTADCKVIADTLGGYGYAMLNCSVCAKDVEQVVRFGGDYSPKKLCQMCTEKMAELFVS